MSHPMMQCGCAANGICQGRPSCAIHFGIHPGATLVAEVQPDLTGRLAECTYCHTQKPSSPELSFFHHSPDKATDSYYDGCRGWD